MSTNEKAAGGNGGDRKVEILGWRIFERNSLRAFFSVRIGGLCLSDCSYHQNGIKRWINFPSKEYLGQDGQKRYQPLVTCPDNATGARIQQAVLEAIDDYIQQLRSAGQ